MACALIAVASTLLSLSISGIAGWSRGDTALNSALWAALGVLATSVAHLFIAVARLGSWPSRVLSWLLWAGCMTFAVVSHASYFLASQQASGALREVTGAPVPAVAGRPLSRILADRAKLEEEAARLADATCGRDCSSTRRRSAAVRARLVVLDQEAVEFQQSLSELRATRKAKERARSDPALWAISGLVNVPPEAVHLGLGLLVGLLLDGVGCLSWAILLRGRKESHTVTPGESTGPQPSTAADAVTRPPVAVSNAPDCDWPARVSIPPRTLQDPNFDHRFEELLSRAQQGLASGAVRNTVRGLRDHLRCSQETASEINRTLKGQQTAN
jgi:hypothetical protein